MTFSCKQKAKVEGEGSAAASQQKRAEEQPQPHYASSLLKRTIVQPQALDEKRF